MAPTQPFHALSAQTRPRTASHEPHQKISNLPTPVDLLVLNDLLAGYDEDKKHDIISGFKCVLGLVLLAKKSVL